MDSFASLLRRALRNNGYMEKGTDASLLLRFILPIVQCICIYKTGVFQMETSCAIIRGRAVSPPIYLKILVIFYSFVPLPALQIPETGARMVDTGISMGCEICPLGKD